MEEIVKKLRKIEEVSHFFLSPRQNEGTETQNELPPRADQSAQSTSTSAVFNFAPENSATAHGKPFPEAFCKSVDQGALGVIWLDSDRVVRHVNAAAQQFLSVREEEMQGKLFNFFIRINETIQISIFRRNRRPGVGEMHMMEMEYNGEKTYLLSIKDITKHLIKKDGKTLFPLTADSPSAAAPIS